MFAGGLLVGKFMYDKDLKIYEYEI